MDAVAYQVSFDKEQLALLCANYDRRIDSLDAENKRLKAENTKLRKLAVLQSVIFKHMSTCPTTDCQACLVNDECDESVYLEGVLGIDD